MADHAADVDHTRDRIEEVALSLLLKEGFDGTPLRLIAAAANVTTPALYWHFSSKGDLCSAAVAREYENFSRAIMTAIKPEAPDQQLRAYVMTFVRYQLEQRRAEMGLALDDLAASLPDAHRSRIVEIQRRLHDLLRDILEAGKRREIFACADESVTAFAITAMCNYVFTWYKGDGKLSVDEVARGYANLAHRLAIGAGARRRRTTESVTELGVGGPAA